MATSTNTGAFYGIGVYGTSKYGSVGVIVVPDGVQAVCTTDSGLIITADANHVVVGIVGSGLVGSIGPDQVIGDANVPVVGVVATGAVGDNLTFSLGHREDVTGVEGVGNTSAPTVVAKARVEPSGVFGTGFIGTVSIDAEAVVLVTGVEATAELGITSLITVNRLPVTGLEATGAVGTVVIVAKAVTNVTGVSSVGICGTVNVTAASVFIVTGVQATGAANDVTIAENARPTFDGVQGTGVIGTAVITVTVFDYNAVRDLYAPYRTVFVGRRSSSKDRTVLVPQQNRTVYVEANQSRDRLLLAA